MSDAPPKQPVTGTDSVRMDTGTAFTPFPGANAEPDPVPVTPASPPQGGMSASAALVSMHNAAAQGDAFPVLKAFQDYLEAERQRARRRMTTLGVVFAIVIVAVVGAFILIWFSTMRGVQDTNRQLLEAALKRANAEPPAPVVVQPPPQPSAAETAKVIAEAVSRAQSEQSAVFAKTLEGLNASLAAVRQDNADMKAEIERAKAAAAKAEADRVAAEKAAAERAVAAERERAAKEQAAKEAAQKAAASASPAAPQKAEGQRSKVETPAAPGTLPAAAHALAPAGGPGAVPAAPAKPASPPQPPKPAPLQVPKYDAPPPPDGFSQDAMAIRIPKEPRPISWRVYVPTRSE